MDLFYLFIILAIIVILLFGLSRGFSIRSAYEKFTDSINVIIPSDKGIMFEVINNPPAIMDLPIFQFIMPKKEKPQITLAEVMANAPTIYSECLQTEDINNINKTLFLFYANPTYESIKQEILQTINCFYLNTPSFICADYMDITKAFKIHEILGVCKLMFILKTKPNPILEDNMLPIVKFIVMQYITPFYQPKSNKSEMSQSISAMSDRITSNFQALIFAKLQEVDAEINPENPYYSISEDVGLVIESLNKYVANISYGDVYNIYTASKISPEIGFCKAMIILRSKEKITLKSNNNALEQIRNPVTNILELIKSSSSGTLRCDNIIHIINKFLEKFKNLKTNKIDLNHPTATLLCEFWNASKSAYKCRSKNLPECLCSPKETDKPLYP